MRVEFLPSVCMAFWDILEGALCFWLGLLWGETPAEKVYAYILGAQNQCAHIQRYRINSITCFSFANQPNGDGLQSEVNQIVGNLQRD